MDDEPTAVYEIRLQGASAALLRRQFPTASVGATRTETVLLHQVERPAELDDLIDRLQSLGLVLTEIHQVGPPSSSSGAPEEQEGTP